MLGVGSPYSFLSRDFLTHSGSTQIVPVLSENPTTSIVNFCRYAEHTVTCVVPLLIRLKNTIVVPSKGTKFSPNSIINNIETSQFVATNFHPELD